MKSTGRGILRRTGVVLTGMLLVGGMSTGAAFAQGTTDTTTGTTTGGLTSLTDTLTDAATTNSTTGTTSTTSTTNPVTDAVSAVTDALTQGATAVTDTLTNIATTNATTSSTPTTPSGGNTVIQYSPYPVPVFGDYGHRYYGKYYDNGCGCDRYAAPTYAPQTVVATQVASVPKGGVDTGDGSFQ